MQVGMVGEGEEWQLIHQLPNEPDARSMEVPDLNPFTYYRYGARRRGAARTAVGSAWRPALTLAPALSPPISASACYR